MTPLTPLTLPPPPAAAEHPADGPLPGLRRQALRLRHLAADRARGRGPRGAGNARLRGPRGAPVRAHQPQDRYVVRSYCSRAGGKFWLDG